ncbi:hypothetical protein [Nocardioides sp. MH1]|uniref:hypothetical protein n=1 Tax=Nocardioides sp. MH1 TaxID=3242490 RepID=UPI003520E2C0
MRELLEVQAGVVSRAQMITAGATDNDLRRLVRRRRLARVHPRVYVDHTGPLTWAQRAWAATLSCTPAALADESAIRAAEGPGRRRHDDGRPILVAVDHTRRVRAPVGVVAVRTVGLDDKVLWNASPPRMRTEHAVVRMASKASSDIDAVAFLADAVGARMTTGSRLADALASCARIGRRPFLEAVIADVTAGTCSTLERGYLDRVERPHALPTATRQFRDSVNGPLYRDALYVDLDLVVELDGRMYHSVARRHDADLERDLDAAVARLATIRLGWGQVFDRPCRTAASLGRIMAAHGWAGEVARCPRCPPTYPIAA